MKHAQFLIFGILACCVHSCFSYQMMPHGGSSARKAAATAEAKQPAAVSRREAIMNCILSLSSASAATVLLAEPSPALADVTRQSLKKSYFRKSVFQLH
jgi:hypothetical protein